jgi:hypothetical protein
MSRWTGWRIGRTSSAEFAALFVLSLFMALLGPFHTAEVALLIRAPYWMACLMGGGVIAALIEPLLFRIGSLATAPRLRAAAQAFVMTVPITLLVNIVSYTLLDGRLTLGGYLDFFPQVLVVDVGVVLLAWLIRSLIRPVEPAKPAPAANPLADRLPPALARARLIAVEAEDHYLRIHTSGGAALVYMRFADALQTVLNHDGLQVHRSWWVARGAVDAVAWNDGRGELTLGNGLKVPVSRSYAKAVKTTPWAEPAQ